MKIQDVELSGEPLVLATRDQVDSLESRYWITFPAGYREYVTQLGEGTLSDYIRVYPPWRIERELDGWRRRIDEYWFWDASAEKLPKERALECVIVCDTVAGDEVVFHPCRRDRLFLLPRDSDRIHEIGSDLFSAIHWLCTSGVIEDPFSERRFEPFDSREEFDHGGEENQGDRDTKGESLTDLKKIAMRWAKRHSARQKAEADLQDELAKHPGSVAKLVSQSVLFEGEEGFWPGYYALFRVRDEESRLLIGEFSWHTTLDSHGFMYTPNKENLAKLKKRKG